MRSLPSVSCSNSLIVGEILNRLARSGVDGRAIARVQLVVDMPVGRVPRAHQVAELQVHVVEQVRDETVRQVGRAVILRSSFPGGSRAAAL